MSPDVALSARPNGKPRYRAQDYRSFHPGRTANTTDPPLRTARPGKHSLLRVLGAFSPRRDQPASRASACDIRLLASLPGAITPDVRGCSFSSVSDRWPGSAVSRCFSLLSVSPLRHARCAAIIRFGYSAIVAALFLVIGKIACRLTMRLRAASLLSGMSPDFP